MKGRKRVVDTLGLPLAVAVSRRHSGPRRPVGAGPALGRFPRLLIWAWGLRRQIGRVGQDGGRLDLELVRRPAQQHTFQVLPRRWVVERTFPNLQRRLSKDYEACETTETWIYILTGLTLRRLARPHF